MVAGSIFANASSTGANTVNSSPLRVSTRFTSGLSSPLTAETSVVSIGLLDAATATGSCDMPWIEPAPSGTCSAYASQPGPTRFAAGSMVSGADSDVSDVSGVVGSAGSSAESPPPMEHPASTSTLANPSDSAAVIFFLVLNISLPPGSEPRSPRR